MIQSGRAIGKLAGYWLLANAWPLAFPVHDFTLALNTMILSVLLAVL